MAHEDVSIISVVVASHRKDYVGELAALLTAEIKRDGSAEVIIVADYAVEELAGCYPRIHWLYHPDISISAKRNRGISCARGSVIGFTDDDCRPLAGWLCTARQYLADNPNVAGVEGETRIEKAEGGSGLHREFRRLERRGFRTNNIFYRTDILRAAGGFDERFTVQREDIDLALTIMKRGHTVGYCEDIKVEHCFRADEKWDLLKNCWNRRFDPLLYKKHHVLYRKHIETPFTPSIGTVLAMHLLLIVGTMCAPSAFPIFILLNVVGVLAVSLRSTGVRLPCLPSIGRGFLSYAVSPFVLLSALVLGSIRAKRILLV